MMTSDKKRYALIIIWESGEENYYFYETKEKAENRGQAFDMAFGAQVKYWWIKEL